MRSFCRRYCAFSVLALLWGMAPPDAQGQARLNLDFEPDVNRSAPLLFWTWSKNPAAHVALDTTAAAHQGRGSVRFDLDAEEPAPSVAFLTYALPTDSLRGTLTVRAWLRTAGFHGTAGLYTYVYGAVPAEALAQVDSVRRRPADGGWQLLELQLPVGAAATRMLLGFRAQGTGQVWLDAVELRAGQRPYRDRPLPGTEPYLLPAEPPNWDFERPLSASLHAPVYTPDSASPARGRRSLRLTLPAGSPGTRLYVGALPVAATSRGQTLTVSGRVRQLAPGPAPALTYALLSEPRNPAGTRTHSPIRERPVFHEVPLAPAPGPAWQPFRVDVPLPPEHNPDFRLTLSLGVRLDGAGTVGLDDVAFALDGRPYAAAPATDAAAPTAAETAWLRRHLLPLPASPPGADGAPLAALRPVLGAARVVGLGQAAPGSADLARWQFRVFQLLAEQHGFTYLVLDADMAATQALDAYVQGAAGDALTLLGSLEAGWSSPSWVARVQWLRAYNLRPGAVRLHVAGLRPQQPLAALAALRQDRGWQDPAARELLRQAEQALTALVHAVRLGASPVELGPPATTASRRVQELVTYLDVQAKTTGRPASPALLAWPQHLLRLLAQYATAYTLPGRQRGFYQSGALAENVYWLGQEYPAAKLAVWGPNELVALTDTEDRPLGEWLRALYGPAYVAIGTAFHRGTYPAGPTGLATAQPAYLGTVEAWLHAAGQPAAFLPLRALPLGDETAWLFQKQLFRDIRRPAPAQEFHLHQPRLEFDGLLFVDEIRE
jgi:erythromycin esterase-like protein